MEETLLNILYILTWIGWGLLTIIPSILLWKYFPKEEVVSYFENLSKVHRNRFRVKFIDNKRGRGIFASCDLKVGDRVLIEAPFVCCMTGGPSEDPIIRSCVYCLKPLFIDDKNLPPPSGIFRCRQNCSVLYCSSLCRDDAWESFHRDLCLFGGSDKTKNNLFHFHEHLAKNGNNLQFLLTAKIFAILKQKIEDGMTLDEALLPLKFMTGFAYWKTLKGKRPNVSESLLQTFLSEMKFFHSSPVYHPLFDPLLTDVAKYTSFQMMIWFNAFVLTVTHQGLSIKASCLAPAGTFFNHSCEPNTAWRYNVHARQMEFVVAKMIKKGEEISISYLPDLSLNVSERRRTLRQRFRFTCECPRCLVDLKQLKRSQSQRREEEDKKRK